MILSAFELIEFHHAGHQFARELVVGDILQAAQAITATSFRPAQEANTLSKARETRNSSGRPPRYPVAWAVNKSALKEAITVFRDSTEAYRATQTFRNFDWRIPASPTSDELSSPLTEQTPDRSTSSEQPAAPRKEATQSSTTGGVPFRVKDPPEHSNYKQPSVTLDNGTPPNGNRGLSNAPRLPTITEGIASSRQPTHSNSQNDEQPSATEKIASNCQPTHSEPPSSQHSSVSASTTSQHRRQHTSVSSNESVELLPNTMASNNFPNAALLEQIEAMINRAITARMATPQPINLPPEQAAGDKSSR